MILHLNIYFIRFLASLWTTSSSELILLVFFSCLPERFYEIKPFLILCFNMQFFKIGCNPKKMGLTPIFLGFEIVRFLQKLVNQLIKMRNKDFWKWPLCFKHSLDALICFKNPLDAFMVFKVLPDFLVWLIKFYTQCDGSSVLQFSVC